MKKITVLLFCLLSLNFVFAQNEVEDFVLVSLDGILSEGEYSEVITNGDFSVAMALSQDEKILYCAVSSNAQGWIALGLGSKLIDDTFMVKAFRKGDNQYINETMGIGFQQIDTANQLLAFYIAKEDGVTTLEFALPAKNYLKHNQVQFVAASSSSQYFRHIYTKKAGGVFVFPQKPINE
ncbi:MAG: hypothetical protein E7062_00680 [Spirochaetaceae bacterium]|nr:hypothetical protein [Spirochaetaceae bacterium]